MQFLLSIEETARNRILHQGIAMLLEICDLFAAEGHGHLLFLLQGLAFIDEPVILSTNLIVSHKGIDALADGLHSGLLKDCLAEFLGFLQDRRLFKGALHMSI